jgi:hypothetical protein
LPPHTNHFEEETLEHNIWFNFKVAQTLLTKHDDHFFKPGILTMADFILRWYTSVESQTFHIIVTFKQFGWRKVSTFTYRHTLRW